FGRMFYGIYCQSRKSLDILKGVKKKMGRTEKENTSSNLFWRHQNWAKSLLQFRFITKIVVKLRQQQLGCAA
ncbi:hypothetical protein, partial [Lacticaseibacillus rhamnosus]|uniref:hypothetical protein n=1 Tax=Lacticaseibacillus rhamnosus TaxID=47715 RepID=UPI0022DF25FF